MARLTSARTNHVTRWVLPAATRLLIDAASKGAPCERLADVAHVQMGQSPPSASCNAVGDGLALIGGPADLGLTLPNATRWTNRPRKECLPGDIIVCVRATIGEPRWSDGRYCLGRGVAAIRPRTDDVSSSFLFRVIEAGENQLREVGTGTTFKTISKVHLAAIPVPLPPRSLQDQIAAFLDWLQTKGDAERPRFEEAPFLPHSLSKQRRIVARIEELAARTEQANRLRMKALGEARLLVQAEAGRVFSALSALLEPRNFGSFSPHVTSGPRNWAAQYSESGWRFYRAQDIGPNGDLSQSNPVYIVPPESGQGRSARLESGDLMLVITGATVGRVTVFPGGANPGFVSQHVAICRLPGTAVNPRFALWGLLSPMGQQQLLGQRYGQGKPGLNLENIRALKLPFPNRAEQDHVVQHLDAVQTKADLLLKMQSAATAELNALLPSILEKAFEGEL